MDSNISTKLHLRKMSDSLNFGPEWIRNLSSDGNISGSGGGTKYQLADYRYGREEMLALFEKGLKAPEPLPSFPSLYVEHTQVPLALIPMTEDENRLWQSRPAPPIATRGRGGSLERGRGRGRGTTFHQFRSSSGFDEPIRSYERNQGGWQERNGGVADGPEWGGVGSSPRKELGNRSIGSSGMDWRRHRLEEESDGWRNNSSNHRPDKWNRSPLSNSWREGDPGEERYERTIVTERPARTSWHSGDGAHLSRTRRPWEVTSEDHLPEWATENLHESGGSGSFDSSGAFHGNSAEDEHGQRGVQKSASQHNIPQSTRAHSLHTSQSAHTLSIKAVTEKSESPQPSDRGEQATVRMPHKKVASPSPPIERKPSPPETPIQKEKEKVDVKSNNIGNDATNGNKSEINKTVKNKPREESIEKIKKLPVHENSIEKEVQKQENTPPPLEKKQTSHNTNGLPNSKTQPVNEEVTFVKRNEDEFDRMQEVADDLVAKLMLDEEAPNSKNSFNLSSLQRSIENDMKTQSTFNLQSNLLPNSLLGSQQPPPPPNLNAGQDKWYYRDPQGDVQGPFLASDMTEWYRAGYFSVTLLLKRHCDERFFTLGELVKLCGNAGTAPFAKTLRLPPVKTNPIEPTNMMSGVQTPAKPAAQPGLDTDALHRLQQMQLQQSLQQQMLIRQAMALQALSQTEPSWAGLSALQQRELVAQHILSQPPIMPESPYINPLATSNIQPNNPLMQMINQMQQANKLPPQPPINETKLPNSIPSQKLDPIQQLIQQMGGMQQPHSTTPSGIPPPGSQHPMSLPGMPGPPSGMEHLNHQHPNSLPDDPIKTFLRQFSNQQQQQQPQPQQPPQQQPVDSFWSQGSFPNTNQQPSWLTNPSPTPNNTANTQPVSMWGNDVLANLPQQQRPIPQQPTPPQPDTPTPMTNVAAPKENQKRQQEQQKEVTVNQKKGDEEKEKLTKKKQEDDKKKRELAEKEKKRKDQELEKVKAKEAEEKRKEDLKKQELERKATEERNKKELERLKKNMEKAKKEAEEKRQRELEEKRRLKEQRKAEEEARKKQEDDKKKAVDDEKKKEQDRKAQEDQSRRQQEALRKMQETQQQQRARVAPWYQAGGPGGSVPGAPGAATKTMTLTEIQKAEKERRAAELALQQQQAKAQAIKEAQEMQIAAEKSQMQLKWASKVAAMPKKVKSLSEIQAEEQERLAKQAAEARLAQLKDKKETASPVQSVGIWESASQSLTWGQNAGAGFWDDTSSMQQQTKPIQKPSGVTKSASAISINQNSNKNQTQNKINTPTGKTKTKSGKQDQSNVLKLLDSNGMELGIEFSSWCTKALGALNSDVDIPTFIGFLMEIESPYEVKDYVRTYLGEGNPSNDFARQFLERRSKAKQRNRAALQQTDDMCVPAPAVNPSNITNEFQEVKGKAKKVKKSRMMKVDARILGFSVTAAQDRINVGDRDYGDNA